LFKDQIPLRYPASEGSLAGSLMEFGFYSFCLLVPWGRLSWLYISVWVHVNTIYRTV